MAAKVKGQSLAWGFTVRGCQWLGFTRVLMVWSSSLLDRHSDKRMRAAAGIDTEVRDKSQGPPLHCVGPALQVLFIGLPYQLHKRADDKSIPNTDRSTKRKSMGLSLSWGNTTHTSCTQSLHYSQCGKYNRRLHQINHNVHTFRWEWHRWSTSTESRQTTSSA